MPHLSYKEFKDRFGDLGIAKYVKAMYLEEGCEEIGVVKMEYGGLVSQSFTEATGQRIYVTPDLTDFNNPGLRLASGVYSQNFNTISDNRTIDATKPYDIYSGTTKIIANLPSTWTEAQCQAYLKYKVILYKKKPATVINPAVKIEGELGKFLNAQGEWTTGSISLGAFKYEVTGGYTYDVVNAKAASSSYIMFLDSNGNRIGNAIAMTSTNYPKVGDTRPMQMPSNCKYVWLVMSSTNVNLPIPLLN